MFQMLPGTGVLFPDNASHTRMQTSSANRVRFH
jgi:hypothetical protein